MDETNQRIALAFGIAAMAWLMFSFAVGGDGEPFLPHVFYLPGNRTFTVPGIAFEGGGITIVVPPPEEGGPQNPFNPPSSGGQTPPPLSPPSSPPPAPPPPPPQAPPEWPLTTLSVVVSPNPIQMGGVVIGYVTGDKAGSPVTVTVIHLGVASVQTISGALGADGIYTVPPTQINTPGIWSFTATSGGITSNTVLLEVRGILVDIEPDSVSRATAGAQGYLHVYSHYAGTALDVHAALDGIFDMGPMYEFYYTTLDATNAGGYVGAMVSWSGVPSNDHFEVDVRHPGNGDMSRNYDGTDWIRVDP